jgi:hypothetical protein
MTKEIPEYGLVCLLFAFKAEINVITKHSTGGHVRLDLASRDGGMTHRIMSSNLSNFPIIQLFQIIVYYNVSKVPRGLLRRRKGKLS